MENYFNYFSEIEEHFQRRRGTLIMGSTLDWALMETWKNAGIPLAAVLRGIDAAFDRYDQRSTKTRKINGLAWCSQAVLVAAEEMKEAAVGAATGEAHPDKLISNQGFDRQAISRFFLRNAAILSAVMFPANTRIAVNTVASDCADTLRKLAQELLADRAMRLEDLERHLTVLEEKLFAALLTAASDEEVVQLRAQADREISPYRSKMVAPQLEQLHKQYLHKRLMEQYKLPRLSLFYM